MSRADDIEKLRKDATTKIDISLKFIEGVSQIDEAKKKFMRQRLDALRAQVQQVRADGKDEFMRQSAYNQMRQTVDKVLKEIFSMTHSTVYVENDMTYHPINQEMLFVTRDQARRIRDLEAQIRGLQAQIVEGNRRIYELEALVTVLTRERDDLKTENKDLTDALDVLANRYRDLAATAETLQTISDNQAAEIGKLRNTIRMFLDSLRAHKNVIADLRAKLKIYESLDEKQKAAIADLDRQLTIVTEDRRLYMDLCKEMIRYLSRYLGIEEKIPDDPHELNEVFDTVMRSLHGITEIMQGAVGSNTGTLLKLSEELENENKKALDNLGAADGSGLYMQLNAAYRNLSNDHKMEKTRITEHARKAQQRLEQRLNEEKKKNDELQRALDTKKDEFTDLQRELENKTNQLANCVRELDTCRAENDELRAEIERLRARVASLEQQLQELQRNDEAGATLSSLYDIIVRIFVRLGQEFDLKRDDYKAYKGALQTIESGIDNLINQLQRLSSGFAATVAPENIEPSPEPSSPRSKGANSEKKVTAKNAAIDRELSDLRTRNKELEEELRRQQIKHNKLIEDLERTTAIARDVLEVKAYNRQLVKDLEERNAENQRLSSENRQLNHRYGQLETTKDAELKQMREIYDSKFMEQHNKHKAEKQARRKEFDDQLAAQLREAKENEEKLREEFDNERQLMQLQLIEANKKHATDGKVEEITSLLNKFVETFDIFARDFTSALVLHGGDKSKCITSLERAIGSLGEIDVNTVEDIYPDIAGSIGNIKANLEDLTKHFGKKNDADSKVMGSYEPSYHSRSRHHGGNDTRSSAMSYLIGLIVLLVIYVLFAVVATLLSPRKKPKVLFVKCKPADGINPSKIENVPIST